MLEELQKENDISRQEVIEFLKISKFNLERFVIREFKDFPGAVELIDEKGRSIVIFYNYLIDQIEVIYKDVKKDALDMYLSVIMFLVNEYKEESIKLREIMEIERINENQLRFIKKCKENVLKNKIIEISPIFDINNDLYDMYEYLLNRIKEMDNKVEEREELTINETEKIEMEKLFKMYKPLNEKQKESIKKIVEEVEKEGIDGKHIEPIDEKSKETLRNILKEVDKTDTEKLEERDIKDENKSIKP